MDRTFKVLWLVGLSALAMLAATILASPAFAKTPTLHTCVTQWNTAQLGNGHL